MLGTHCFRVSGHTIHFIYTSAAKFELGLGCQKAVVV